MAGQAPQAGERTVHVPFGAWYDEAELSLTFPPGWQVHRLEPDDASPISSSRIDEAFAKPVGSKSLRELAAGKRSAVIAVDDLTRPAPVHLFLPNLIEELTSGGIDQARITILMGVAAHRPMDEDELSKKLGPEILARFPPIMHDFMGDDVRFIGWVSGGPVCLNRHFLDAELRICVGGVIPHGEAGFGGGAKMVVPGVAGRRTIAHFHGALPARPGGQMEGRNGIIDRREWAERVARHVNVHAAVCAVVNARRQLAGLYVGDVVEAHRAAAKQAQRIGRTPIASDLAERADVVVVNAYPLDTDPIQMGKSIGIARKLAVKSTVVINAASDGIFYHGMGMGSGLSLQRLLRNVPGWLTSPTDMASYFRSMLRTLREPILAARLGYFSLNHLAYADFQRKSSKLTSELEDAQVFQEPPSTLVYSKQFPQWGFRRRYREANLYRTWDKLRDVLAARHDKAVALVLPCAPLQLPELV
jgi:nickel-dependent lactate racemase